MFSFYRMQCRGFRKLQIFKNHVLWSTTVHFYEQLRCFCKSIDFLCLKRFLFPICMPFETLIILFSNLLVTAIVSFPHLGRSDAETSPVVLLMPLACVARPFMPMFLISDGSFYMPPHASPAYADIKVLEHTTVTILACIVGLTKRTPPRNTAESAVLCSRLT